MSRGGVSGRWPRLGAVVLAALACGMAFADTLASAGAVAGGERPRFEEELAESCHYVEAGPPGPRGNRLVLREFAGHTLRRRGDLISTDGGVNCERLGVTVEEVDRIVFETGPEGVEIDERGGLFAPGATPERNGSEIEIEIREADKLTLHRGRGASRTRIENGPGGTIGFNLNPPADRDRPDQDVWMSRAELERIKVYAEQGEDLIDSRRLTGVADNPNRFLRFRFFGGAGDDTILGGREEEEVIDGPGDDLIRAGGNDDEIGFGPGRDTVYGGRDDGLFYEFIGLGPRSLDAADSLFGGPGADFLSDRNGKQDLMRCGPGSDEVEREARDRLGRDCERYSRR